MPPCHLMSKRKSTDLNKMVDLIVQSNYKENLRCGFLGIQFCGKSSTLHLKR